MRPGGGWGHRRLADLQRLVQRPVQAVLRCHRSRRVPRQAGADRRDRRHAPTFARDRARHPPAVRLSPGGRRPDRRLRRDRGWGQGAVATMAASSNGSNGQPRSSPRDAHGPPRRAMHSPIRCPSRTCCAGARPRRSSVRPNDCVRPRRTSRARASRGACSSGSAGPRRPPSRSGPRPGGRSGAASGRPDRDCPRRPRSPRRSARRA